MIEIERKFLVASDAFKHDIKNSYRIIQGFLNTDPDRVVRVRVISDHGILTVKGLSSSDGLKRFEWEKKISKQDAEELLKLCEPGVVDKMRYEVVSGTHIYEIDEFFGDNDGLIIAEIELDHENEQFIRPDWLGEEVTGIAKYYNAQLSKYPYKSWK